LSKISIAGITESEAVYEVRMTEHLRTFHLLCRREEEEINVEATVKVTKGWSAIEGEQPNEFQSFNPDDIDVVTDLTKEEEETVVGIIEAKLVTSGFNKREAGE
jgi:hypothetical protein